jgi:hypothetical protein
MRLISALCTVILIGVPSWGANTSITLFLDGALVNNETTAIKDNIIFPIPASFKEGSLRVKPLEGCQVDRVEIETGKTDPLIAREITRLGERRGVLNDRLKALEIRESIFLSAAKSQSGKALRKTKSNPEPLASVRQGTEYAISQLEGVYRARRIAETELKPLVEREEALKKALHEKAARISLSKKDCRIEISYLRTDLKWIPAYNFRLNKTGEADVFIRAVLPKTEKGARVSVVASILGEMDESVTTMPVTDENSKGLISFKFPVENEKLSSKPISTLSFSFKNLSTLKLPPGEATCFFRGEYLGKTLFKGAAPGEAVDLSFGN